MAEQIIETTDAVVYAAASAIGIVAGMRAMTAPAIVAYMASAGCLPKERSRFGLFGLPGALKICALLAGGEAIFDKLPFMPRRTEQAGLTTRIVSGAICGATICAAKNKSAVIGAIAGTFGAIGATFAAYQMRMSFSRELGMPDAAFALLEDTTAVWVGKVICEELKTKELTAAN